MKKIISSALITLALVGNLLVSCKKVFDENDIQNNPNAVTDVDVRTLLSGTLLGVAFLHEDTDVRIASIWAGELNGISRAHLAYAQYVVSPQTFFWTTLYPVASQARLIQIKADALNDKWTMGVGQVLEALCIAKATALYGDVPYNQAFDAAQYPTPVFDKQADVYTALQATLDNAISNLQATTGMAFGAQDFIYQGDVAKWKAAAYTLKARLYLHTAQYAKAITNAALGISSTGGDALIPHGTSQGINMNQNYDFFAVSRAGDTGFEGTFLKTLLQDRINSANTKTNEQALFDHFIKAGISGTGSLDANTIDGAFTADAPHPIVTYYENQLIIAEAQARVGDNEKSLMALNNVRVALADGYIYGKTFSAAKRRYDPYIISDFIIGGIANPVKLQSIQTALLYEIISQRYIILLMQYEAFNDYRRLASAVPVVQLPIKLYSGVKKPQRFIYPQAEINSNPNVPQMPPDQFIQVAIFP
jgi:starch-binding outer membrane protein, SusD/RagB family